MELKHNVVEVGVAGVPPSRQLHPHEGARLPAQSSRPPINEDMDPSQSTATALEHSLSLDDSEEDQRLQTTPYAASTFQPWLRKVKISVLDLSKLAPLTMNLRMVG